MAIPIIITDKPKLYIFTHCIVSSGGSLTMTMDESITILQMDKDEAVKIILQLSEKAEKYDQMCGKPEPTTPSGMTHVYLKPRSKKGKPKGRPKGHTGAGRKKPKKINKYKITLSRVALIAIVH